LRIARDAEQSALTRIAPNAAAPDLWTILASGPRAATVFGELINRGDDAMTKPLDAFLCDLLSTHPHDPANARYLVPLENPEDEENTTAGCAWKSAV